MMPQKTPRYRALTRYGLPVQLFLLMLILVLATVNNGNASPTAGKIFLTPAIAITIDNSGMGLMLTDTIPKDKAIFNIVEKAPEFPGGLTEFGHFLGSNIHYPQVDKNNKVEGRVIIQFIVEKDGSISGIKAVRGPSQTLITEAVRVMKLSPRWKPGYQNGKAVRVAYTVPVNFALNNDKPVVPVPNRSGASVTNDGDKIYASVAKQPEFPGGMSAFGQFLGSNIHYPQVDRNNKVEGTVFLQFIVEKDGSISGIKALRGPSQTLINEGIRVIQQSPRWTPGYQNGKPVRVAYTVPIKFSLNDGKTPVHGAVADTGKNNKAFIPNLLDNAPLIVIDGVTKDKYTLDTMDQNTIESVTVLKDASATATYGALAQNGVILITTKNVKTPVKPTK